MVAQRGGEHDLRQRQYQYQCPSQDHQFGAHGFPFLYACMRPADCSEQSKLQRDFLRKRKHVYNFRSRAHDARLPPTLPEPDR